MREGKQNPDGADTAKNGTGRQCFWKVTAHKDNGDGEDTIDEEFSFDFIFHYPWKLSTGEKNPKYWTSIISN